MWIDEGPLGGLVVYGTSEEWQRFAAGLEDLYSELKHDVLPGADNPANAGDDVAAPWRDSSDVTKKSITSSPLRRCRRTV